MNSTDAERVNRYKAFRKLGSLGKLHNIAVHLRASPQRTNEFKKLADRVIPLDNATRWNSWFYMVAVALDLERSVEAYIKEHFDTLREDCLGVEDWKELRRTNNFLEVFKSCTMKAQGNDGLLHESIYNLDIMKRWIARHLIRRRNERKTEFHKRCENALTVLEEYRTKMIKESTLYMLAIALHPSHRVKYFRENWSAEDKSKFQPFQRLHESYEKYKHQFAASHRDQMPPPPSPLQSDKESPEAPYLTLRNELAPYKRIYENEWEEFQSIEPHDINCSPISWWMDQKQKDRWPTLSKIALNIMPIPAMSDAAESAFSGGRRTISVGTPGSE